MSKATGYVLFEDPNIAIIATMESENEKTGNMVQVWILPRDVDPNTAVRTGQDDIVCFDCKHRGWFDGTKWVDRSCYVTVFQAPLSVWNGYQRGIYPRLKPSGYRIVFAGRKIRFGAYGEPILLPVRLMRKLAAVSDGWTGYTHQWMHPEYQVYREFLMASVDNPAEYAAAKDLGWRTFRARTAAQSIGAREISCPASDEMGKRTTCERCTLCSGVMSPTDPRKDIVIIVHGAKAKNFVSIGDIAAAPASAPAAPDMAAVLALLLQHGNRPGTLVSVREE